MKLINKDGVVVAEAVTILYDEGKSGWVVDGAIFTDVEKMLTLLVEAKVSPVEFKLLFTAQERVAINASRSDDHVIDDFFSIIEDSRLTHVNLGLQSTRDGLNYLESKGLITADRLTQILAGQVQ